MRVGTYGRPIRPVDLKWPISLPFGAIKEGLWASHDDHLGTDFATPCGVPCYASEDGMIIDVRRDNPNLPLLQRGWGNCIYLQSGNDLYIYGHLSEIMVTPGQKVRRWDCIGKTGESGNCRGPHLHWERRYRKWDGETWIWVPMPTMFFDQNGAYYY